MLLILQSILTSIEFSSVNTRVELFNVIVILETTLIFPEEYVLPPKSRCLFIKYDFPGSTPPSEKSPSAAVIAPERFITGETATFCQPSGISAFANNSPFLITQLTKVSSVENFIV